jgi:hypothetical protein
VRSGAGAEASVTDQELAEEPGGHTPPTDPDRWVSVSDQDLPDGLIDQLESPLDRARPRGWCVPLPRTPNMLGDFFGGYPAGARGTYELDRLTVIVNDLDVPGTLPPGGSALTITEPGPVGIYSSSVVNVQQLQQALRAGAPLPPAALAGVIAADGTMTTGLTISQIQALLASTPQAYDIIPLAPPPPAYHAAVDAAFQTRNPIAATTTYDGPGSGAMLQGGVDSLTGGEDFDAFYFYAYNLAVHVPSPSAGLGPAGRTKVADGNSPLPQDRAYFHYGLFSGVPVAPNGLTMNRFTPGFEKTLWDGTASVEMRFPFAASLDSSIHVPDGIGGQDVEFGNIAVYLKVLLYANDRWALSGGLGVTSPTAEDLKVRLADGTPLLRVENDSPHLQPFLAGLFTPNDRWFAQGFLQLDVDPHGNSLLFNTGHGLTPVGRLNDSTYLMADAGIGYWLHRTSAGLLTGIAPTVELHYNTSLQETDSVALGGLRVGNFGDRVEALNLTAGATFCFGPSSRLAVGYVAPLGSGADRQLDSGLRVLFDYQPPSHF